MPQFALFGLHITMSLLSSTLIAVLFVWPWLRRLPREQALVWMIAPHTVIRFIGISFLVEGVVSPAVPSDFAWSAATGDAIAGVLAMVAVTGLARKASWTTAAVWLFNVEGAADLLAAYYKGITAHMPPGALGAAYYIPTTMVPLLLVMHGLTFALLMRPKVNLVQA